jgi:AMME syndrome candidate gene 1 protein
MCQYCFDIVIRDLTNINPSKDSIPPFMDGLSPTIECPLFVTWDLKDPTSSIEYTLRGCIGTLSPRPLATAIRDYALTSAFRDNRFHPVTLDEIPNLRVGVSLLVKYEECRDSLDWEVGVHGILIKFHANEMDYSATYLPEVAKQQWYASFF